MLPEKQFQLFSYAAVFCGFLSLWVSGSFGIFETVIFIAVMLSAWRLEDTQWQIRERLGTVMIVMAIPLFYLLLQYRFFSFSSSELILPGILARLILSLSAIKLLQRKSSRDWMFLYVMAFFQVLLAAGLSISVGYLAAFTAFVFVMAGTIILFEIRKTETSIGLKSRASVSDKEPVTASLGARRVLTLSTVLITLIALFAVPLFFLLPRVGGAGIGGNRNEISAIAGFSDTVRLGGIGRIQQNDEIVMRVRINGEVPNAIRWRGVALDTFDGQSWSRTKAAMREPRTRNDRDLIQVETARGQEGMTLQTVYLEPFDPPVLFGMSRIVGIQGNFPLIYRDAHGALSYQRTGERVSYKVVSDRTVPADRDLRLDRIPYSEDFENYLQLYSEIDPRIGDLAAQVTARSINRFDAARSIETYLQTTFGYTLEQKAAGIDPLADFLFNVREGHCEYFATAMAVMLRTQGVASRVVNGFQRGDYNQTADVFVVRQRHAHSWVEVYFPESGTWVEFDPTPASGQISENAAIGITNRLRVYFEALETFWIQYFVAFDNQEQRSLFVTLRRGFADYQGSITSAWNVVQSEFVDWWRQVRGDEGFSSRISAIALALLLIVGIGISLIVIVWTIRKAVRSKYWRVLWNRFFAPDRATAVEFYERMLSILERKGFSRRSYQTPLEFAYEVGMPEAVSLTQKYNRVRFGERRISIDEVKEIESLLSGLGRKDEN